MRILHFSFGAIWRKMITFAATARPRPRLVPPVPPVRTAAAVPAVPAATASGAPITQAHHTMKETFTKAERICSQIVVDQLFSGGNPSLAVYPLRAVYMLQPAGERGAQPSGGAGRGTAADIPMQLLISVPKRRLHRAVDRNRLKRQIRESYRRAKHTLWAQLAERQQHLSLAIVCITDKPSSTAHVNAAVCKILRRISERLDD